MYRTARTRILSLLTHLERRFKVDLRYIVKGGGAMTIGQVCVSFIGLATSIAFANLLPKDAYGTYQYVLTSAEFLTTFSLIGLSRALVTSSARGYDGSFDDAFRKGNLWGLGAILLGIVIGGYYLYKGNMLLGLGIALGTALTLIISNAKLYISFLNGKKLFTQTSVSIVLGLLIPGIAVIGALFFTDDLLILLSVYFIGNTVVNLALFYWSRRFVENTNTDPELITQAFHLSAQALIGRLGASVDRLLLFQFAGPIILAEYWIAQNIQRNFSHLFKSANSVALPKLTTRSYSDLQRGLPRKILLLYGIIIPFTLAYVLVTPYIVTFLFPQYTPIILLTQAFGILFLFLPIQIFADALVGHGKNRALYQIAWISSTIKLGATISLVPLFGFWGVLGAMIVEQSLSSGLILWHFFVDHSHEARSHT